MTNGGTPFCHKLFLANSRRGHTASSPLHTSNTTLVKLNTPYSATIVLDNFFGWQFNGLNDMEVLKGGEGGVAVLFADAHVSSVLPACRFANGVVDHLSFLTCAGMVS